MSNGFPPLVQLTALPGENDNLVSDHFASRHVRVSRNFPRRRVPDVIALLSLVLSFSPSMAPFLLLFHDVVVSVQHQNVLRDH